MSDTQQQEGRYFPPGPPPTEFVGFSGLNTQAARPSIQDDQCSWLDGFMPIGESTARTMWGVGEGIFPGQFGAIVWYDFGNIGATPICIVFLSDGSIYQINTDTKAQTVMAPPGTISAPDRQEMGITQWGAQFIIIVANQTNGYFLWDGTTFYKSGDSVPGFTTMPTGIQGTSAEVYQSRVWVSNGPTIEFSSPQSLTDFSSGSGGGTFQSTDSFVKVGFTQLRQTNGFLYLIADSSINYISGVTTGGSPVTTTFSNQNADPETGTVWGATVDVFSRNIVFANAFGAHISYGGAVTKISDPLDGVYSSVPNFGGLIPSACKAIVFSKRIWALLLPVIDAVTGTQKTKLFCWDGKKWWSTEQDVVLKFVQHQEINSVITAYGTDGNDIYPLFKSPSSGFTKTIQSKLFSKPGGWPFLKSTDRIWGVAQYYSTVSTTLDIDIDNESGPSPVSVALLPDAASWTASSGVTATWTSTGGAVTWFVTGAFSGGYAVFPPTPVAQNGVLLGFTATTNCPDMAILGMSMSHQIAGYRG